MSDQVNVNRDLVNQYFISIDDSSLILLTMAARRFYEHFDSDFLDSLVYNFIHNPEYHGDKNITDPVEQLYHFAFILEQFIGVD